MQRGKSGAEIASAKTYGLPEGTFGSSVVTPELANESALAEALGRMRAENGRWEKVSILLPDSWFRINLVELPSLPDKPEAAHDAVRWSLKRTLPIPPESLRVAYEILGKSPAGVKLLVISATEKTLATIEQLFTAAGMEVILIEPIGLNIWNAITVREAATSNDRLFVYVRENDFTTAVFRGSQPLFIRSRNLNGERSLPQEIRLSATYLRDTLQSMAVERCYVAGNRVGADVQAVLTSEFSAPVVPVALRDYAGGAPSHLSGMDAELTACTGVFTG
jgi:Tfp pilus assembly PilM family ATPase